MGDASVSLSLSPPTKTWRSLKAARRQTRRELGPLSSYFYFYEMASSPGRWRRSMAMPYLDAIQVEPASEVDRGAYRIPRRSRRRGQREDDSLLRFKRGRGYLYHLTSAPQYLRIRHEGLVPGAGLGIVTADPTGRTGYEEHVEGAVFLSDAAGLRYGMAMQGPAVKVGEHVLLRTRQKCPVDEHGSYDASRWLRKRSTSYRCVHEIPAVQLEVWDAQAKKWRPLADVEMVTQFETVLAATRDNPEQSIEHTKARLLSWNPLPALPVVKKGLVPHLVLGAIGQRAIFVYRGWEIEVNRQSPGLWEAHISPPPGTECALHVPEVLRAPSFWDALCTVKIRIDLREAIASLPAEDRVHLADLWDGLLRAARRCAERQPDHEVTRADVARFFEARRQGWRQSGKREPGALTWWDSLPLPTRVAVVDDVLQYARCQWGPSSKWPWPD